MPSLPLTNADKLADSEDRGYGLYSGTSEVWDLSSDCWSPPLVACVWKVVRVGVRRNGKGEWFFSLGGWPCLFPSCFFFTWWFFRFPTENFSKSHFESEWFGLSLDMKYEAINHWLLVGPWIFGYELHANWKQVVVTVGQSTIASSQHNLRRSALEKHNFDETTVGSTRVDRFTSWWKVPTKH